MRKKIKICYVIVNCKITGPMRQTLNIIKNIDSKVFDVCLITLFKEEYGNSMLDEYLKYCQKHFCLKLNKFSAVFCGRKLLRKILQNIQPDITHSLGMPPYRLSLGYKHAIPLLTLRNYPYDDYPSYYNKIIGPILAFLDIRLIKKQLKHNYKFIVCSQSLSQIYKKKQNLSLDYIRNGVDLEKFQAHPQNKVQMRKALNLPTTKTIFIYTAPFNDRKNQIELLNIFSRPEFSKNMLVLCGNGEQQPQLKKAFQKFKNIIFTGKITNIPSYLQAADIYISSSKSEGLPNSVLEAMATGLPVILSNIDQHLELVNLSNIGFTYKLGDYNDLGNKINKMLKSDRNILGHNSAKLCKEQLSSQKMAFSYQNLYLLLAQNHWGVSNVSN